MWWPFKKRVVETVVAVDPVGGVTITEDEETIGVRERSVMSGRKVRILKALIDVVADEDLDAVLLANMTALRGLGYNLRDEPEALLEALKRSFYA
jgi:hypothetical protein